MGNPLARESRPSGQPGEPGAELREPDQEHRSLLDGLSFRADLPLQLQLHPFLQSLEATTTTWTEPLKTDTGVQEAFTSIPFMPWRNDPKGCASKKNSPDVRPTDDGGAPRRRLVDVDGVRALSLNEATDVKGFVDAAKTIRKHPLLEINLRFQDLMNDAAILRVSICSALWWGQWMTRRASSI